MSVAIVGSGISGTTAANYLTTRGIQVTVFSDGPGRLMTRTLGDGHVYDRGCPCLPMSLDSEDMPLWVAPKFATLDAQTRILEYENDRVMGVVGYPGLRPEVTHVEAYVDSIRRRLGRISINGSYEYDSVLVATPPRAARLLSNGMIIAAKAATVRTTACFVAGFLVPDKVARGIPFDAASIFNSSVVQWVSNESSKPDRDVEDSEQTCWTVHSTHTWARASRDKPHDQVIAEMGQELCSLVGMRPMQIDEYSIKYWNTAQCTQNAPPEKGFIVDEDGFYYCGDWCSEQGGIEGAIDSGHRAAIEVAQTMQ